MGARHWEPLRALVGAVMLVVASTGLGACGQDSGAQDQSAASQKQGSAATQNQGSIAAAQNQGSSGTQNQGYIVAQNSTTQSQAPLVAQNAAGTTQATARTAQNPDPWPRTVQIDGATMTVYQPQVDSWNGGFLQLRAAVALKPGGSTSEVFGVIRASAHTLVNKSSRMVTLFNFSLLHVNFPTLPEHGKSYFAAVSKALPGVTEQISLDRLQAFMSVEQVTTKTVPVKNEPPQILVSYKPAVLVPVNGDPVLRTIEGTSYQRVMNTGALIVYAPSGDIYLHLYDGWMQASALQGPWQVAANVPPALAKIAEELSKNGKVDLLAGGKTTPKPSLKTSAPAVYVTTVPSELLVFKGEPWFQPIDDTDLLWVTNSSADVIMDTDNNDYYVLISGRWFHAPKLTGPWTFVASSDLPGDFRKIPASSPAARVLTAVAGTAQAKEAVIANSIPQTAVIPRKGGPAYKPNIDGAPQMRPIDGTSLQYVVNTPDAIIEVTPTSWYALRSGVWFTASSLQGSWTVATSIPDVIYTIPSSSPLHYVTYVNIYWVSPESVQTGYTPGYMGTAVTSDGTVVYGTGYDYTGYVGNTVYYPPPPTYGYAVYPAFDVAEGAMFGYDMGLATASYFVEPAPVWGPVYYGYGGGYYGGYYPYGPYYGYNADHPCCYYNTGYENVYGHYGNTTYNGYHDYGVNPYTGNVGETSAYHTYNSATGTSSNIHSYSGYNAYTGTEGAGYNRTLYNQNTGNVGDVDRNEAYNPETGNFEHNGSAQGYNPNTGSSADVQHTSTGNAYNGSSAGETTATVTNGKTGQTNTYGVAHNGNDVYAGSDGNVYRNDGSGWQQNTGNGWQNMNTSSSDLDRFSQARSSGESRYNSFSNRGFFGGGGGGGGSFHRFGR